MKQKEHIFEGVLRSAGFKVTPQKLLILEALGREERPVTLRALKESLPAVDRVTIYRALEAFTEKEIVRKIDTKHAYTHYELSATRAHHHHAICVDCGKIEDVELCLPDSLKTQVEKSLKHFSTISSHSMEFSGTCTGCTRSGSAS